MGELVVQLSQRVETFAADDDRLGRHTCYIGLPALDAAGL